MEQLDGKCELYGWLSFTGMCGLAVLIGVYSFDVEPIARVALLMLCGVLFTLGLVGICGWSAYAIGRRVRFVGEDACAFAGGIAGSVLLFTIGYYI